MSLKTYQDYLEIEQTDKAKAEFVWDCIQQHKSSDFYRMAEVAEDYASHKNRTIRTYQKFLYEASGERVPDTYSANYKLSSNFFGRFVTQQVQFLLGNGVTFESEETKTKLGKSFDSQVQKLARFALVGGVGYGLFNKDHIDVFSALEFVPLWDEENGALRAGVRYWQIDDDKPLRATFYEDDGYTEFIRRESTEGKDSVLEIMQEKRAYIVRSVASDADVADGDVIYEGINYPTFPIVPLWGNHYKQSELVGIREQIDCYDLIKSGYADTIDEASFIYWSISNAGGMDDIDVKEFMDRLRRLRAAITTDFQATAEPHQIEAPYQGRGDLLDRIRADLYEDYQALDTKNLASGAVTATQIEAAYEPVNSKADDFEYCVTTFIDGILAIMGIDDEPTYSRSMIVNRTEEIQTVMQSAQYLSQDYVTRKILTLLGDGDMAGEVIEQMELIDYARMNEQQAEEEQAEESEEVVEE